MSEEKLTVAELMARAGKEPTSDRPRRRRRSLDEGGISVADLTGSQRRVVAPGPRRGAHAVEEPDTTDQRAESPAPEQVVDKPHTTGEPDAVVAPEVPQEPQPEPSAAPAFPSAFNVPAAVPANPVVIDSNPGNDELTLALTAFHDAADGITPVAEPGSTVKEILGLQKPQSRPTVTAPGDASTDVHPIVPSEDAETHTPQDALTKPVSTPKATPEPEVAVKETDPRGSEADATATAEVAGMAEEVNQGLPVSEPTYEPLFTDPEPRGKRKPAAAVPEPDREDSVAEEDNSLSIALLVVQVIVGLVAGAFIFVAFTYIWARLSVVLAVIAAIVVTIAMVVLANSLRRKRDTLTPILAGIVGLLLTFGPYLLMMR